VAAVQTKILFAGELAATERVTTVQSLSVEKIYSIPCATAKLMTLMSRVALEISCTRNVRLNLRVDSVFITVC
jgi:hypothetical protein